MEDINFFNYQSKALEFEADNVKILENMRGIPGIVTPRLTNRIRLIHASLGISSDVHELMTAKDDTNLIEEVGDVLWFCCLALDVLKKNIEDFVVLEFDPKEHPEEMDLYGPAAEIANLAKKVVVGGKTEVNGVQLYDLIYGHCRDIVLRLRYQIDWKSKGLEFEDVMGANIAKLTARYQGKKFTTEAFLNRTLSEELKAIEDAVN